MDAYAIGELFGAIFGMVLIGSGIAWLLRRVVRKLDFNNSLGIAMLLLAICAGVTNSNPTRPYLATLTLYLVAAVPAFFIALAISRRLSPAMTPPDRQNIREVRPALNSRINWRRGFVRVWMVLTGLWITGVVLLGWGTIASPYIPFRIVATPASTGMTTLFPDYGEPFQTFSSLTSSGQLVATQVRPGYTLYTSSSLTAPMLQSRVNEAAALVEEYVRSETVLRRSQALPVLAAAALIPPIVMLALGWAIGWVAAGFRRVA